MYKRKHAPNFFSRKTLDFLQRNNITYLPKFWKEKNESTHLEIDLFFGSAVVVSQSNSECIQYRLSIEKYTT